MTTRFSMPIIHPSQWPEATVYLVKPRYADHLPAETLQQLHAPLKSIDAAQVVGLAEARLPCTRVKIRSIVAASHPANGQSGLFAARPLPPSSFIICYLGYIHSNDQSDPTSSYDLSLDRDLGLGVDSTYMGNEARFINDYRGVREDGPNAEFRDCWVDLGNGVAERSVGIYVLPAGKSGKRGKGIGKGEEIVISYGKGFWRESGVV